MQQTLRPGGFQILPPIIKNLLIINVLFYFATIVLKQAEIVDLNYYLALFHWESPYFKPWQILTHMFMHGNFAHLFFNMFALWIFGNMLEGVLGEKRFIIFYLVCGIGAAALHMGVFHWEMREALAYINSLNTEEYESIIWRPNLKINIPTVGASGAVFGVLFAFGYLFPNIHIYLYFLFPIRAKYFVAVYALIELWQGFANNPGDNVAHFAHVGGMLFAYILFRIWKIRYNPFNR